MKNKGDNANVCSLAGKAFHLLQKDRKFLRSVFGKHHDKTKRVLIKEASHLKMILRTQDLSNYFASFERWQITSIEKLKASAKATPCQNDCSLTKAIIIIIKQKMLTITVKAFLSVKYCLICCECYMVDPTRGVILTNVIPENFPFTA